MILAHQYLGQLEPKLQEAFSANTSIKFAGGVSAKDARTFAPQMHCDASFIESQPKGSYATHVRGMTKGALPLSFPFGLLESLPQMSSGQRDSLQQLMRDRYAMHYSDLEGQHSETGEPERVEKEQTQSTEQSKPGQINTDAGSDW